MLDHLEGRSGEEIVERDNGFFHIGAGPELYFAPFQRWRGHERGAMRWVRGRTLDVGCGAGRVVLHLQDRGMDVVGFDLSPLAIEVCRRRGATNVEVRSISHVGSDMGTFDTIVMLGGNFGLLGSRNRGRRLLRRLASMTNDGARLVAATRDPYVTDDEADLAYLRRNERRGRMPGQWRIRIRYRDLKTPWFDYLTVSRIEMEEMLVGTGWHATRYLDGPAGRYTAILTK
jgi:SAM-dependent methyltransferase